MSSAGSRLLNSSSEAWHLLTGMAVLYKPANVSTSTMIRRVKQRLIDDLNGLHQKQQWDRAKAVQLEHGIRNDLVPGPIATLASSRKQTVKNPPEFYTCHPLVLGDGFEEADLRMKGVNSMPFRSCGILLVTVNAPWMARQVAAARMLRTFRVKVEFGKSTDTGHIDGKVIDRVRNPYLARHKVEKALSSVQSSHQKSAFAAANIASITSQEAYELAAKGPLRPAHDLDFRQNLFVFGLRCVAYEHPRLELEFSAFSENEDEIIALVSELGRKLKAGAVCSQIRCIRYGHFDLDMALLEKHADLPAVVNNVYAVEKLMEENGGLPKSRQFVPANDVPMSNLNSELRDLAEE